MHPMTLYAGAYSAIMRYILLYSYPNVFHKSFHILFTVRQWRISMFNFNALFFSYPFVMRGSGVRVSSPAPLSPMNIMNSAPRPF
ncbi:protein of unknown function [Magnetospirillum sp. XM-1]|nr:protein of unknown function [Magnetospirillum sp. XM-1]